MTLYHPGLAEVVRQDPRYAYEAYEFLFHALNHTQKLLGREPVQRRVLGRTARPVRLGRRRL